MPAYFQELMTGVLKDVPFAITYLDDIIIFSRIANATFYQRYPVPQHHRNQTSTIENSNHLQHAPTKIVKQVCIFLRLLGYYRKFVKDFARMAKQLTLLTNHKATFK